MLPDAITHTPYAVVLLDEIEKAHPDIFNILLQVMDHATLTDHNGKKADFRNAILIMTSNAGATEMAAGGIGFGNEKGVAQSEGKQAIEKMFRPEFRNRLDAIVHFNPLGPDIMNKIVDKFIDQLEGQLMDKKVQLVLTPEAREYLAKKGHSDVFGARPMERLIEQEIKRELASKLLFGDLVNGGTVEIGLKEEQLVFKVTPLPPTQKKQKKPVTDPV